MISLDLIEVSMIYETMFQVAQSVHWGNTHQFKYQLKREFMEEVLKKKEACVALRAMDHAAQLFDLKFNYLKLINA